MENFMKLERPGGFLLLQMSPVWQFAETREWVSPWTTDYHILCVDAHRMSGACKPGIQL